MPDSQSSSFNHVSFLTLVSRCLSGEWLIDADWLMANADQLLRQENSADGKGAWPGVTNCLMLGGRSQAYQAADKGDTVGKGQALGQINIAGPIRKYGWGSSKMIGEMLGMMATDERVGGVKIKIDSAGGQTSGTRELYQLIQNFPKPTLLVVDGMMLSAAYYLGCGAGRIVATQPTDMIGSIGTYATYTDMKAMYEAMGAKIHEVYAPGSSEKNEDSRQILESDGKLTALAQKWLGTMNDQFITDVRAGRGDKLNPKAGDPMKGRIFYAADAVANGLIDELVGEGETLGLLADMIVTNQKSTIQMGLLDSLKGLIQQAEQGGESSGAAENAGPTAEQLATQVTALTTERDTATGQVTTLTQQIATLTQERDQARQERDAFGDQPGDNPTKVKKAADKVEGEQTTKTLDEEIDGLESTQLAKANGLWD